MRRRAHRELLRERRKAALKGQVIRAMLGLAQVGQWNQAAREDSFEAFLRASDGEGAQCHDALAAMLGGRTEGA